MSTPHPFHLPAQPGWDMVPGPGPVPGRGAAINATGPVPDRAAARKADRAAGDATGGPSGLQGSSLAALYVSLAAVGVAALASAAASSLMAGFAGLSGAQVWWQLAALAASCAWAALCLLYAFLSFRSSSPLWPVAAPRTALVAVSVHLAALLAGLWRLPEASRTFDVTLASLLALELSVLAVLGWTRNSIQRTPPRASRRQPSALAVVGMLFAASLTVSAVTTAGMAASTAGQLAVPHGSHGGTSHHPGIPGNLQELKDSGHHH